MGIGTGLKIRRATEEDSLLILGFIRALAEYERMSDECIATEASVRETLFGEKPAAEVLLAYFNDRPAGFALFFSNYSTFLSRPGLYLEDLFVDPLLRGRGIGKGLLRTLAGIALERNCGRLEWTVLDWNVDAIRFYKSLGAVGMTEWTVHRLAGESLKRLAEEA